MSVRPLKKPGDRSGYYESADGRWFFSRDDEGYRPGPNERRVDGERSVQPGRRWDIGVIHGPGLVGRRHHPERVIVSTARTLAEAVAYAETKDAAGT